jgi:CheY-like chemotaxis protein
LDKILVVDDSAVLRDVMTAVLSPYCSEIVTAVDCASARAAVAAHADLSLILCDVVLPDGSGLDLVSEFAAPPGGRPNVILMTARPERADERRARADGAVGYLAKPISLRDIVAALRKVEGKRSAAPRVRAQPLGQAVIMNRESTPDAGVWRAFDIRDMSTTGAFLETPGPLEVGTDLDLCIDVGGSRARVVARTVRVQAPDWGVVGGIGVAFNEFESGSRELLTLRLGELDSSRH